MIDPTNINADWHLCEQFSLDDAAALIAGYEPSSLYFSPNGKVWFTEDFADFFDNEAEIVLAIKAIKKAIVHAITLGSLKANIETFFISSHEQICGGRTTIHEDDLRDWLKSRSRITGFFFEKYNSEPLNRQYNQTDEECSTTELERQLAEISEELNVVKNDLAEAKSKLPRHDTELLQRVRDVQERYWGDNWDKNNPDSKSTKENIVGWLKREYNLSKVKADAVEAVACPINRTRST